MRQTGAGFAAFVDECMHVRESLATRGCGALAPCGCHAVDLLVGQLRERAHVTGRVDDDLLPLERGIEVRDDAHDPARLAADAKCLRRRAVLAPLAERTLVELGLGRRRGTPRPAGR